MTNIQEYIKTTELDKNYTQFPSIDQIKENNQVNDQFNEIFKSTDLVKDDLQKYYEFTVPKLGQGGTCSLRTEFEQFNLCSIIGEKTNEKDLYLSRLNKLIDLVQKRTNVDWLGFYKVFENVNGSDHSGLVKLAYYGEYSRPIFPLTLEWTTMSGNSWVGYYGKSKVIESVSKYEGPYYNCSDKVKSELCIPIFNQQQKVIGIIDAESWKDDFFTLDKVIEIIQVSLFLSKHL
ncbi:hypothetical protein CYY_008424 [Polysphondylium violaceum]|uniref:GAF domain-containing protein n=1 Tax=Polysphondylium violaceum TaxID=133409 RepID=A0A8J4PN88_9MYCE|nr:hypothetical protein CYY_008424 [Polysphondylium violaceum]